MSKNYFLVMASLCLALFMNTPLYAEGTGPTPRKNARVREIDMYCQTIDKEKDSPASKLEVREKKYTPCGWKNYPAMLTGYFRHGRLILLTHEAEGPDDSGEKNKFCYDNDQLIYAFHEEWIDGETTHTLSYFQNGPDTHPDVARQAQELLDFFTSKESCFESKL